MSLTTLTYIAADLIALAVLVGALYAPRHSRKDLMAAYIGVNVGVLAVTLLLSTASVAAGLAWGSSASCPSSACAPPSWPSTRWPTSSRPWPWACSAGSRPRPSGWWRPSWAPSSLPCGSATTRHSCAATVTR